MTSDLDSGQSLAPIAFVLQGFGVLYVPTLGLEKSYDRGVSYFASNWLRLADTALATLAATGGLP